MIVQKFIYLVRHMQLYTSACTCSFVKEAWHVNSPTVNTVTLSWPDKLHVLALMECILISFAASIASICMHIDIDIYLI